jgi:hypothetical protein
MPTDEASTKPGADDRKGDGPAEKRPLPPEAERALAEAAARRRAAHDGEQAAKPKEIAGRDGPEPTRYGDWEINGIASDF